MKRCNTCIFCKRLYRNDCGFFLEPENKLYCVSRENIVKSEYFCEKWQKKKAEYDLSPQRFDDAVADIRHMMELIKE